MNCTRDQRLTRATFPTDQNRQIGIHHPRDQSVKRLHRRGFTDQRQLFGPIRVFRGLVLARGDIAVLQRARRALHQVRQVEWLGQIVIRLGLGGLNGGHDCVLRGNHNHRKVRSILMDFRQHFQTVAVGHDDVGNDHIALSFANPAHQSRQGRRRMHLTPRACQRLRQNCPDRAIIISYKNCTVHQSVSFASRGASGREMRKRVFPGTLSTEIHPS